jgi:aconitate hydratase
LHLDGTEVYDIHIPAGLSPQQDLVVSVTRKDGTKMQFTALCRIDTPIEVDYFQHGGILPFVLRELMAA